MDGFITTEQHLQEIVAALVARDPRLGAVLALSGPPPLRRRPQGFEGLAAIVVSQQLSTASAAAIWGRLRAGIEPFHHTALLRARKPKLQRAGLSEGKIKTLRAIAKAVEAGTIDFEALAMLSADEAHGMLTAVHGIGPWTADLYLLFCLGHADAWPSGDLALQEAARLAFGLERRPTAKEMIVHAEPWRPWRGVAARLLWAYYRAAKGREAVPIQPAASAKDGNDDTARRPTA